MTTRPVVSAGRNGTHLNRLTFTVDKTTGAVTATTQALLPLVAYPADAPTQTIVDAAVTQAGVLGTRELGTLARPINRARLAGGDVNRGGESTLGNLVAETQRAAGGSQIAFVSPTTLGADLPGESVTYRQAADVQPSADPLVTMRLTGGQIESALEQQWQRNVDGSVPAQAFLRLGSSTGFTSTYDPTQPEGARITGMWLDGTAVRSTTTYSVTISSLLASGGDNFRAFARGAGAHDNGKTPLAALLEHVEAATGPVVADATQHAVGVAYPGGFAASYGAGEAFDVDLTSLAFSTASDAKDTAVHVSLAGRSLGDVAVDNAVAGDATDEQGRAAVRIVIPADLVAGPAVVTITGTTTGTSVKLPITVTRNDPPVLASSSTAIIATSPIAVRRGTASVSVAVASGSGTPAGAVELLVDGAVVATLPLSGGRATATVGPFDTAGARSVTARYLGSDTTAPSTSPVARVVVTRATATVAAAVQPTTVTARKTRATVRIAVTAPDLTPTGKVTVKIGRKTYAGTLTNGHLTIRLARFMSAGTVRATVTYLGDARARSASTTIRIRVVKAGR